MSQLPVIRSRQDAKAHVPDAPALVEVPGEFVLGVVSLMEALRKPADSHKRKLARSLLRAAAMAK
jgi:hypothetical protein